MTTERGTKRTGYPAAATDPAGVPEPPKPLDPARVAAALMLATALQAAGTDWAAAGADGAIVVVSVPAVEWTLIAQSAWKTAARRNDAYQDGLRERSWDDSFWVCWAPVETPKAYALREAADILAMSASQGRHYAAFTADPEWLPADLKLCADFHLSMPLLSGADLTVLARVVAGGQPTEEFPDEYAASLTPRLLRLAHRRGQTADVYLRKLRELLERELSANAAKDVTLRPKSIRESPGLERLNGMTAAVEWGLSLANDLRLYRAGKLSWGDLDQALLLSGPPGCGKTLFARALAVSCEIPLITGSYAEWLANGSGHQGDLLKAMRAAFKRARDRAPCILFLDEIDSFPDRTTVAPHNADWNTQVVNALLAEIDGVEGREGVILLGACNHPDRLDPALVRSGRLTRHIRVDLPDCPGLIAILREHLGGELAGENLHAAAVAAAGSTGADCEQFVRGARRRARSAGRTLLLEDLLAELGGEEDRNPRELKIAAVHEAGHAIACLELRPGALTAISLRSAGISGGTTTAVVRSGYLSAEDIRQRLIMDLAGRAAEDVILGQPSSGAGGGADSDLATATRRATAAAASLGLDPKIGLVWLGSPDSASLPGMLGSNPMLAARVSVVIDAAYFQAVALIRRRAAAVRALATALLDKRSLDGEEAAAIADQHPGDPAGAAS